MVWRRMLWELRDSWKTAVNDGDWEPLQRIDRQTYEWRLAFLELLSELKMASHSEKQGLESWTNIIFIMKKIQSSSCLMSSELWLMLFIPWSSHGTLRTPDAQWSNTSWSKLKFYHLQSNLFPEGSGNHMPAQCILFNAPQRERKASWKLDS